MISFVQVLDFIGTFAFAISGIRLASAKRFDWFGAYVVGFVTAIGGGTMRDLLLDVTPVWMTDPMYLLCTAFSLFWVIAFSKYLIHLHNTFFIFDTLEGFRQVIEKKDRCSAGSSAPGHALFLVDVGYPEEIFE